MLTFKCQQKVTPIRDHTEFLNGYAPEDEGLYDDYPLHIDISKNSCGVGILPAERDSLLERSNKKLGWELPTHD
ncbi:hypothetical protein ACE1CI_35820 [Aerosakkonemataceae cyanobacterium BLCC-F50]|uniref:Uncharacterized protein n=1 Tax=Floridaenema flaviceps BLCC-F50 TaxID=3153642 RepID=A0ABV4Y2U5_9CYAN